MHSESGLMPSRMELLQEILAKRTYFYGEYQESLHEDKACSFLETKEHLKVLKAHNWAVP